jgi:class 3 adenylate cyclase
MTIKEDLAIKIAEFASESWGDIPNARVLPTAQDLSFANSGERLDACVLYADVHRSTEMVDTLPDTLAAEYYKAFLHCAGKIIRRNDGNIQAYDGDRVMAIYLGDGKADRAVSTALELHFAVHEIINPTFQNAYPASHRRLQHTVGIDTGTVLAAKTGVRDAHDLVWVGPAANYAAKLNSFSGLDIDYPTRITTSVFEQLSHPQLYNGNDIMWMGEYNNTGKKHYRSGWFRHLP